MVTFNFDGVDKCIDIILGAGESDVSINVKSDLYSNWKEWALLTDNLKYLPAFSSVGGEPKGGGKYVGSVFFLTNGWKICPHITENDATITFVGELLNENPALPIVVYDDILAGQHLQIVRETPNYSETIVVSTGGSALTTDEHNQLMKTLTKNQFLALK